jgi:hypothetical protein
MSADVIRVNFETRKVLDIERGTPSLLRQSGRATIAKLALAERPEEQDYEYYVEAAIRLGFAIKELEAEKELPDNAVTYEEMRSLRVPFNRALAQLNPEDQKRVWDIVSRPEHLNLSK